MIESFRGDYDFLSNFYPCVIDYEGITYPSVEHAYQAAKTDDTEIKIMIANMSASKAKRHGRKLKVANNWNHRKLHVMVELVSQKFERHLDLRQKLIDTKNEIIIEGNTWGDTFWGVCNGNGKNFLGIILMNIRSEYATSEGREDVSEMW